MLRRFFKDESGQGMVEYALIIALIAVVVIAAVIALSGGISDIFEDTADVLEDPGATTAASNPS